METVLFSFVITSYKNHNYIYEAIDSVLNQDYPRIQLIVSDDGSGDFEPNAVREYVKKKKRGNIQDLQVYAHETNRGTVQNMEFCRQKADGDYIMYMAADDALNGSEILSRYAEEFEKLGKDALVLCSSVAMCGENLDDIHSYEPSEEGIRCIREMSPQELFGRLSHTWTIPTTSCCYRREVYDVIGPYDTDYFIIEDGPLFAKLSREGHRIYWIDDMIAARHRGGGISHGNKINLSESYRKYRYDEIIYYEKEILPYKEQLSPSDLKLMNQKWEYIQNAYFDTFVLPNMRGKELLKYQLSHFPQYLKRALHRVREKAVGWILDDWINKNLLIISGAALVGYLLLLFIPLDWDAEVLSTVKMIFSVTWLAAFGFALLLRILRIVKLIFNSIKYIITGRE